MNNITKYAILTLLFGSMNSFGQQLELTIINKSETNLSLVEIIGNKEEKMNAKTTTIPTKKITTLTRQINGITWNGNLQFGSHLEYSIISLLTRKDMKTGGLQLGLKIWFASTTGVYIVNELYNPIQSIERLPKKISAVITVNSFADTKITQLKFEN